MAHAIPLSSNVTLTCVTDPNRPQRAGIVTGYHTDGTYYVARLAVGDRQHEQLHFFEKLVRVDDGTKFVTGQNEWRITAVTGTSNVGEIVNELVKDLDATKAELAKVKAELLNNVSEVAKRLENAIRTAVEGTPATKDRVQQSLNGAGVVAPAAQVTKPK